MECSTRTAPITSCRDVERCRKAGKAGNRMLIGDVIYPYAD